MRPNRFVPEFDFSPAEPLDLAERFRLSLTRIRRGLLRNQYQSISDFPCIPPPASDLEIDALEAQLGLALPVDYRQFLLLHRYLKWDDGYEVGGLPIDGVGVTENPWLSEVHHPGRRFLIFARYWAFADGDQLMFDLSEASYPVVAYLHEHGPTFEFFAPSFSLALWRLSVESA